jgi:outer membrane lipoprotein-sorting protein
MLFKMRKFGLVVAVIGLVLAIAACSGGSESVKQPSPPALVSAAGAISGSAQKFTTDVRSFDGTMSVNATAAGQSFDINGSMKYREPGQIYAEMSADELGDFAMLFEPPSMYVKMDGTWYTADTSSFGIDFGGLEQYVKDRGPVNYADALKGLKDLIRLDDEEIDGHTYWHFSGSVDMSQLTNELPSGIIDPSMLQQAAKAIQSTKMDIYLDPATTLPRRYKMTMAMNILDFPMSVGMQMDFLHYNQDVDIPDIPSDATELPLPQNTPTPEVTCGPTGSPVQLPTPAH